MNLDRSPFPEPPFAVYRPSRCFGRQLRTALLALSLPWVACAAPGGHGREHESPLGMIPCEQLSGVAVPPDALGMPTRGAVVTGAKTIAGSGAGAQVVPEYCLLVGAIHAVDRGPRISISRSPCPPQWNHKVMMFGGGGYDGAIPSMTGNVPAGPADGRTPLQRATSSLAATPDTRRVR